MGVSFESGNSTACVWNETLKQPKARWADIRDEDEGKCTMDEYEKLNCQASPHKKAEAAPIQPSSPPRGKCRPQATSGTWRANSGMRWCMKESCGTWDTWEERKARGRGQRQTWVKAWQGQEGEEAESQDSAHASWKKEKLQKGVKRQSQFVIGIEEDPLFRVGRRLLGPSGSKMKAIAEKTGCRLRLRGRGSWFLEGPNQEESRDPLMLCLSSPCESSHEEAVVLVEELLLQVYADFEVFCKKAGWEVPELRIRRNDGARRGSR